MSWVCPNVKHFPCKAEKTRDEMSQKVQYISALDDTGETAKTIGIWKVFKSTGGRKARHPECVKCQYQCCNAWHTATTHFSDVRMLAGCYPIGYGAAAPRPMTGPEPSHGTPVRYYRKPDKLGAEAEFS